MGCLLLLALLVVGFVVLYFYGGPFVALMVFAAFSAAAYCIIKSELVKQKRLKERLKK